jgi:hypothetical protein
MNMRSAIFMNTAKVNDVPFGQLPETLAFVKLPTGQSQSATSLEVHSPWPL